MIGAIVRPDIWLLLCFVHVDICNLNVNSGVYSHKMIKPSKRCASDK